jgi:hypothetical protein
MDMNPPGGEPRSLGFPPIEQVSNASVHVTQTSSTNVVIPNSKQLYFQWSNPKVRSWILSSPRRSSTTADTQVTSKVQDELLNYTHSPGEEPDVQTRVLTSNLSSVLRLEDDLEKDKHV